MHKSPHILIVDDDLDHLEQMQGYLSQRQARLFQARHVEQAQKIIGKRRIDAIITDWQMPDASGLALVKHLRQSGFEGPLLICTGMMLSDQHLQAAFEAGANDYLRKPLNAVELNARLDHALERFAHQNMLGLYNQSQQRFIHYLGSHLGADLMELQRKHAVKAVEVPENQDFINQMVDDFHQLMDWGRFRFDLPTLEPRAFAVKALLKNLEARFSAHQARLSFRGGRQRDLYSNPELLLRVLTQLIENACEHTSGQVLIEVTALDDALRFSVSDEDIELNEGQLERILDGREVGLGLLIVHDVLNLLHSQLQARRRRHGGNQFFFDIAL